MAESATRVSCSRFERSLTVLALLSSLAVRCSGDVCGKPSADSWEGECSTPAVGGWGDPMGKGYYVMADGSKHEGEFHRGRPVGWGVFTWTNGQRYEGEWKDGQPDGPGIFTWRDGKRYEGLTVGGRQQGYGKFSWPTGDRYYGSFWNGNEHGKGSFLAVDGSTYCGEYREGKGVGTVVVDYADGSRYEGTWNESRVSGVGVSHFNGSKFEGEFSAGLPSGLGVMVAATGAVYKGEWVNGLRNGSGVYTWRDGTAYKGGFLNGRQHGCGVQVRPGWLWGEVAQHGTWVHGQFSNETTGCPDNQTEAEEIASKAVAKAQVAAKARVVAVVGAAELPECKQCADGHGGPGAALHCLERRASAKAQTGNQLGEEPAGETGTAEEGVKESVVLEEGKSAVSEEL